MYTQLAASDLGALSLCNESISADKSADLVHARDGITLAETDQPVKILRLEQQHAQRIGAACFLRAKTSRKESQLRRQGLLVFRGDLAEIFGGTQYQRFDAAKPPAPVFG